MTQPSAPWHFELAAGPFGFTEGPVWDGTALRFSDIPAGRVMRLDPTTATTDVFASDTHRGNGLALDDGGRLVVCESGAGRVVRYDLDGRRQVLAERYEGHRLNAPNDVVVDSAGRIWFTDPRYRDRETMELDHDSVYRLDPAGEAVSIARVTFDTTRPNGLVFSPDERTLYVAESPPAPEGQRQLRAYPVCEDGSLGPVRVLHDFGPYRGIDGMRVDDAGNVVACAGSVDGGPGPRIVVFSPDGAILVEHPIAADPTNCCFGGADLRTLYVTAKDGNLYRAQTDRRGLVRAGTGRPV